LSAATLTADYEMMQYMIQRGAQNWDECLCVACDHFDFDVAEFMISNGATDFNSALKAIIAKREKDDDEEDDEGNDVYHAMMMFLIEEGATDLSLLTLRDITILLSMGLAGDHFSGSDQYQVVQALEKYRKLEQSHVCKCLNFILPIPLLQSLVGPYVCYSSL
jgi:hypothetical protein